MRAKKPKSQLEISPRDFQLARGDEISVIGFRVNPSKFTENIFIIIISSGEDVPLMVNNRIILFNNFNQINRVCNIYTGLSSKAGLTPTEPVFICDIPKILDLIRNKGRDNTASILNLLNTLFDLINALKLSMPTEYKKPLFEFADHLTFDRNFLHFLKKQAISRETIINAIVWCIGAVTLNAEIWCNKYEKGH